MGEHEDIEFLRGVYAGWERGDFTKIEMFAPDLEFVTDYPERSSYHGVAGLVQGWRYFLASWNDFTTTLEEIIPAGEAEYLVHVRLRGFGKESGAPFEAASANLVTIRDGRIARLQLFYDRNEARTAAGLD
jgi:ketosteroid isomerase-like protein